MQRSGNSLNSACDCAQQKNRSAFVDCKEEREAQEGVTHERGTSISRHAQRRFRPNVGCETGTVDCRWSPLWWMGDLPRQRLTGRTGSAVRVADQRLVRTVDPA